MHVLAVPSQFIISLEIIKYSPTEPQGIQLKSYCAHNMWREWSAENNNAYSATGKTQIQNLVLSYLTVTANSHYAALELGTEGGRSKEEGVRRE